MTIFELFRTELERLKQRKDCIDKTTANIKLLSQEIVAQHEAEQKAEELERTKYE